MSTNTRVRRTHPVYGLHSKGASHFNTSDLPPRYTNRTTVVNQAAASTLSAPAAVSALSGRLVAEFQNPTTSCTLELYTVSGNENTLVATFTGVSPLNSVFYVGNLEHIDLQTLPIRVRVLNPVNGWVSVFFEKTV